MMMHEGPLTQEESDHLVQCSNCKQNMVEAVRKELGVNPDDGRPETT